MSTNLFEMEETARKIGRAIGDGLPKDVGFCLVLCHKGDGGWSTWLSNCQREDMIKLLHEIIEKVQPKV